MNRESIVKRLELAVMLRGDLQTQREDLDERDAQLKSEIATLRRWLVELDAQAKKPE